MSGKSPDLRALADRCRRLARGVGTSEVSRSLDLIADDYDRQAEEAAAEEAGPESEDSVRDVS